MNLNGRMLSLPEVSTVSRITAIPLLRRSVRTLSRPYFVDSLFRTMTSTDRNLPVVLADAPNLFVRLLSNIEIDTNSRRK